MASIILQCYITDITTINHVKLFFYCYFYDFIFVVVKDRRIKEKSVWSLQKIWLWFVCDLHLVPANTTNTTSLSSLPLINTNDFNVLTGEAQVCVINRRTHRPVKQTCRGTLSYFKHVVTDYAVLMIVLLLPNCRLCLKVSAPSSTAT